MPLKSIYLLPHGGIIVPGMEPNRDQDKNTKNEADKLLLKMEEIGEEIKSDGIDIVFLTSPHGYIHPTDVQVVFNSVLEAWQYYHANGRVEQMLYRSHSQLSQIFYELLLQKNLPTQPLIFADPSFPMKIAWGEAIPLQFFADFETGPQIVLFSLPMSSVENKDMDLINTVADTLLELCNAPLLNDFNVSIVVSGDLAHKHDNENDYGFSEDAETFDTKTIEWIKNPSQELYEELLNLHKTAASCGIYGMGLIQRLLTKLNSDGWANKDVIYALPTYFGMTIAKWNNKKYDN